MQKEGLMEEASENLTTFFISSGDSFGANLQDFFRNQI